MGMFRVYGIRRRRSPYRPLRENRVYRGYEWRRGYARFEGPDFGIPEPNLIFVHVTSAKQTIVLS